jgi:perosamine synthetase
MIPRFKPPVGAPELAALVSARGTVRDFEQAFARTFEAKDAIAFPYGRSALWAFFKGLGIENAEVVLPAYTCVVAAHAIVLSGNTPRFVDASLGDYNMDLDKLRITERTRAVIATHLFGYPADVELLSGMVRDAERRFGHKIFIVHDCAHAFGARWRGRLVCNEGDAALFGLGISKLLTSIFGGMLTMTSPDISAPVRAFRDRTFRAASVLKPAVQRAYLVASRAAFSRPLYGFVRWLEHETPMLDSLTKAYHLDDQIHFPPDYLERMTDVEARVGLAQLAKYDAIVARHIEHAHYYDEHLRGISGWTLPPIVEGATYSHYVVRVPDRAAVIKALAARGVDLGELIQYSVPHMAAYRRYMGNEEFPNSLLASRHTINLPLNTDLTDAERERIVGILHGVAADTRRADHAWAS